mgnify:CR=1 FL=1|jgi:hypothetical protein
MERDSTDEGVFLFERNPSFTPNISLVSSQTNFRRDVNMRTNWTKWIGLGVLAVVIYRYRYRLINLALGSVILRRLAVSTAMRIPGVRNRLMRLLSPVS